MINVMLWAGLTFSSGSHRSSSGWTTSDAHRKERHILQRKIKMQSLENRDVSEKLSPFYFFLSWLMSGAGRIGVFGKGKGLGFGCFGCSLFTWLLGPDGSAALIYQLGIVRAPFPILQMLWSADLSHGLHSVLALTTHSTSQNLL